MPVRTRNPHEATRIAEAAAEAAWLARGTCVFHPEAYLPVLCYAFGTLVLVLGLFFAWIGIGLGIVSIGLMAVACVGLGWLLLRGASGRVVFEPDRLVVRGLLTRMVRFEEIREVKRENVPPFALVWAVLLTGGFPLVSTTIVGRRGSVHISSASYSASDHALMRRLLWLRAPQARRTLDGRTLVVGYSPARVR